MNRTLSFFLFISATSLTLAMGAPIPLIDPSDVAAGWRFDNGREFPGATGELVVDPGAGVRGEDCLKLIGDFTGGGGYVQAMRRFDPVEIEGLSFQVKAEQATRFTMRIGDGSGQTHQIDIGVEPDSGWQEIEFPIQRFFESRGTAEAVTNVLRYQSWGGADDGKWHGEATYICFLLGNGGSDTVRTMWLQDLDLDPLPQAVEGASVIQTISLSEVYDGLHEWGFSNGPEFKGATGDLVVLEGDSEFPIFQLSGDFTNGGAYCGTTRSLREFNVEDIKAIRMEVRSENVGSITLRLSDSTGQAHQRRGFRIEDSQTWKELVIYPEEIAGGEHWGGAKDGKWHGPAQSLFLSVTNVSAPDKKPVLQFRNVQADMVVPVFSAQPVLTETFETEAIPSDWKTEGNVEISGDSQSLNLTRELDDIETSISVETAAFQVEPGQWLLTLRAQPDLHSPDNSYRAAVDFVGLSSTGEVVETIPALDITGKSEWSNYQRKVDIPTGVKRGALRIHFEKTYGSLGIDDLSVTPLAPAPITESKVDRILFSSVQLGNLLFPDDARDFTVEVHCRKPLTISERDLSWVVRDYWGAEQASVQSVHLGSPEKSGNSFVYRASLPCGDLPLEVGRYYELHASLPGAEGKNSENHSGFAILPEAETHQYAPMEVPFTARNWDNRVEAYVRLTHRLGVRVCGLWGRWSSKPPYEAQVPQLELVKELGMGWLTNTPAAQIERGSTDYTSEALEKGVLNLLENFGDYRPVIVNLGNEPHGTGERVLKNVEAYKTLYKAIKSFDPDLPVVATSVEPNEEYFQAGYGEYCDAFDFHIYESAERVRKTIGEYRELQKEYDVVKPIWSTELGLNSQGMTRLRVAGELHKKFATFFAAGGENVSWFGLLYPDPEGKALGTFGDSHNVFDSRYNRYNPRLDAVAYYHGVNAISVKDFVEEKHYPNGVRAFLFGDSEEKSLIVLWSEEERQDVMLELDGVTDLSGIDIDGSPFSLKSESGKYHLGVAEPLLLRFQGKTQLPEGLPESSVSIGNELSSISRSGTTKIPFETSEELSGKLELAAPPLWKVEGDTIEAPEQTEARELFLVLKGNGNVYLPFRVPVSE